MFTRNPLLIPELLHCILDCFLPTPPLIRDCKKGQALVALAQTCRATSEHSIDRIWRVLHCIEPLVWCSRGISGVEPNEEDEDLDEYRSLDELDEMIPPTPAEWDIIARYAHRVRMIQILYDGPSMRFLKCIGSRPSPLFPNLRCLYWRPHDGHLLGSTALIRPLLSPSLVELDATFTPMDGATVQSFLRDYSLHCPNLKTIGIKFPEYEPVSRATTQELSRSICNYENLESLEVSSPIDDNALRHLAISPTLKRLSMVLDPGNSPAGFACEDAPFFHVEHLRLKTSDLDVVTAFLTPRDQRFDSFSLYLKSRPSAKTVTSFFSALASRSHPKPLRELHFYVAEDIRLRRRLPTPEEVQIYSLSYHSLRPLISLTSLRQLWLDWNFPISLDDDELEDMARSWPWLQVLHLCTHRGVSSTLSAKFPTFNGLLVLIASCPDLRSLSLPIDAREVPAEEENNAGVRNTVIRYLNFLGSPISDAQPVAEFLLRHFPSLTRVSPTFWLNALPRHDDHLLAYQEIWEEVTSCISALRPSSKQEDPDSD